MALSNTWSLQLSRQTAPLAYDSEPCLPVPTQVGMGGDQIRVCDSHQPGQVPRGDTSCVLLWPAGPRDSYGSPRIVYG